MPQIRLVIAGIPRSGTTLVFRALAGLPPGPFTPKGYQGPVVKTHTWQPESMSSNTRALFLFGDPVDSVISTMHHRMDTGHFRNCGYHGLPEQTNLYQKDYLNYERMFDAWFNCTQFPILRVRYETLYATLDTIEVFLGKPLKLPPFRPRKTERTQLTPRELCLVEQTYARLTRKVQSAPDISSNLDQIGSQRVPDRD